MGDNDMTCGQAGTELFYNIKQRVIVRDKDLDEIAHLREFSRRTDEVRHGARGSVPDEDVKALLAQGFTNPASNNAEADQSNIFSGSTGHVTTHNRYPSRDQCSVSLKLNRFACNAEFQEISDRPTAPLFFVFSLRALALIRALEVLRSPALSMLPDRDCAERGEDYR
jgi:hypothetical protein